LKAQFSLERLQKSGAVFDVEKLNWYNSHYIRQAVEQNIPAYYQEVLAFVRQNVLPGVEESLLERIIKVYSARLEYLMLLKERSSYIFSLPDYASEMLVFKKSTKEATTKGLAVAIKALTEVNVTRWVSVEQLETLLKEVATTEGLSFGDVLWPVRVALSGVEQSPSPAELAWILGREE
jgi:glutamyl/glutaminyl-tRNA synthetase